MTDPHEALNRLRATNPVPGAERINPDEISTVVTLCEERRLTPTAAPLPEHLDATRRSIVRPALAFAAAFVAIIVAVGTFSLLGRDGRPVADETPVPTTTPAPSTTITSPVTTTTPVAVTEPWPVWISDTAVGDDGSIWVATNAGLVQWHPDVDSPNVHTTDDGLPFDDVQNIAIAPNGTVWVGGDGWIARSDSLGQSPWVAFPAEDSFGPMAVGPDGSVWSVAGLDRLLRFDGSSWETITVPDLPGNDDPWSFSIDVAPDGIVWAGANDHRGVVSYDGSNFNYYEMWDGRPDQSAATVAVAPDGTIWIGGDIAGDDPGTGVVSFDGTNWNQYTIADGLLSDSARVAIGSDGVVWAIHYGPGGDDVAGVSRFDGSAWTAFSDGPAPGFPAAVDATGKLWAPSSDHASMIGFDGIVTTVLGLPALDAVTPSAIPDPPTPEPAKPHPAVRVGEWNPILAERHAGPTPLAATCPVGTNPDEPGPAGQGRPQPDEYSNQAADFDRVWGRVVYVDSRRKTWTLDICTNTWHEMNADSILPGMIGSVVYDVDSDRSVLFGNGSILVYDRELNTWERRRAPQSDSYGWASIAAFYEPQSGLIVSIGGPVGDDGTHVFSAYDVDTDEWTTIGSIASDFLVLGYSHEADRIVTAGVFSEFGTDLIDPRMGTVELVEEAHPEFIGGFGYSELANGADTAYAMALGSDEFAKTVCGFDSSTLGWECLPSAPPRGRVGYQPFDAITYDWLNERLVFIGGAVHPWGDGESTYFDDVWSLDPETGEWLELLAPSADR